MAIPSNPQQLLLVKDLFDEAQELALREDTFSTSKAILFLDLAVEQMMRAIITSLSPSKHYKKDPTWHELWTDSSTAMQTAGYTLRNEFPLRNLHQDRNRVQHAGATYHFSQARIHVAPVEDMVTHAFHDVYQLNFFRYNLLELIANEDLRRWLQTADEILDDGGPTITVAACNYAHKLVLQTVREHTKERTISNLNPAINGLDLRVTASLHTAFTTLQKETANDIRLLEEEIMAIGVGLSILEVRRFRQLGRLVSISVTANKQVHINWNSGTPEERAEAARFMLNRLSKLIRSIEATYPGVLKALKIAVPLLEQDVVKKARESES